ncbi:hypothetical protein E2P81_ATG10850 [Venturia nashicola]|uniref:Gb n=1 Tax=Venturia nashicola TaxID=86259 RepID=A0A4Z1NSP7_9PEZI|nr:hypothetical protein E6O75_ATG10523 [Venturia nashicola]TLD27562.1 hypothetical protein E2P81_ATG10850 [Venturia nashicola]
MLPSTLITLALSAVACAVDTWGPSVSFLRPSNSTLVYTSTIMQPPEAPTQPKGGFLTIWPGISNGTGDLVQSCLDRYPPGENCSDIVLQPGEWCAVASVFGNLGFPNATLLQHDAPGSIVKAGQHTKLEYILEPNNLNWTQIVTNVASKKLLSTLSTRSEAYMRSWGTAVECQMDCNPPGLHYYFNTTWKFKVAEPAFALRSKLNATFSKPVSADGGITWTVDKITIPATKKAN